jgi:hypothetical protein
LQLLLLDDTRRRLLINANGGGSHRTAGRAVHNAARGNLRFTGKWQFAVLLLQLLILL